MENTDHSQIVIQSLASDIQQLESRMDFFESIVLRLLMGLKEAGVIVDEAEVIDEEESSIILP
jgi:uncharacterized protein YllA (UPF0747 family)